MASGFGNIENSCSSSDEEEGLQDIIVDRLDISEEQADSNLNSAGTEVEEEKDRISVEKYKHLIVTEIDECLDNIVEELSMPYKTSEFQRISVNALAQMKNVVLVSPTGSGKMNVPLQVLRHMLNKPKGVYHHTTFIQHHE